MSNQAIQSTYLLFKEIHKRAKPSSQHICTTYQAKANNQGKQEHACCHRKQIIATQPSDVHVGSSKPKRAIRTRKDI
eukprot:1160256-Pelagomonas_calceolata.AAC.15